MAKVKVELNSRGVRQLLNDAGVAADLRRRAERIAAAAGDGMLVDTSSGTRARAVVITGTADAKKAEATDRRLTRALDAGR